MIPDSSLAIRMVHYTTWMSLYKQKQKMGMTVQKEFILIYI